MQTHVVGRWQRREPGHQPVGAGWPVRSLCCRMPCPSAAPQALAASPGLGCLARPGSDTQGHRHKHVINRINEL